ncbi:FAD binding domain-containing protein [Pleurocapsa sp. FMAR1]|uniref:FAD binding domain-containing protein n=1 Tax=Pleurocapsa sp. FMAR1 TaxID=3040204 RepID=UPI0029C93627|nr:xanthine dehydrogenase family protein subunit M [Pleurocapsa sp. FMAR1]
MKHFTYERAGDRTSAITQVAQNPQAKFIAGGTNFMDMWKEGVETPERLIDIRKLPGNITFNDDGGLRLDASTTNSQVAYHTQVGDRYPVLSQAILAGASPQLRNMATTGGNLMQRNRCSYFHDVSYPCNKRQPNSGCPAIEGINRMHAIFGTSDRCIAAHPSDMCVALAALGAVVQTRKPNGSARSIAFEDFHLLPGDTPEIETALEHGELIEAVEIPSLPWAKRSHYLKVRDRHSYAYALVSAAVALEIEGDKIVNARVALGGVGTKPWRSPEAESALFGAVNNEENFTAAAEAALQGAQPYRYNSFKIDLAKSTLVQALLTASAMEIN